ncbi:MAG: hypothetical protein EBR83_01740 [Verrucomicrobia bacterium]|jgi:hypothetical protein|nr:hypothetical protein [Verrucomicrobiota bacterium]
MCSVELKKPMHPALVLLGLAAVTGVSGSLLYWGVPTTEFHGLQTGIFFPFEVEFDDARFMDNKIKCESKEVTAEVRKALQQIKSDYPVDKAFVTLTNYPSGYKFHVSYVTYYGQRFSFSGEKLFRRGVQVGEPAIDAELKSKDDAFEKAIRAAIEAYFKSKGAQG